MLNRFSCVSFCATPETAAHQAPPIPGILQARTLLLHCMKVKSESEAAQSCPTLRDPMDCSPPGSSIHGIFQARVLEWGAIAFSDIINKRSLISRREIRWKRKTIRNKFIPGTTRF